VTGQRFGVTTRSRGIPSGIMGIAPDTRAGYTKDKPYSLILNTMAKQGRIASRAFSLDLRHADDPTGRLCRTLTLAHIVILKANL
jgi:hypothetical protein